MANDLVGQLVAKTKALGLVTATALVTTALVGGGAVAMTTVSNESPRGAASVSLAGVGEDKRSDTATAKIKKPRNVPAPACGTARNHGAYVSGVAKSAPPGPSHGPKVSAAAKAGCGKPAGATAGTAATTGKPAKKPAKATTGRPGSPGKSAGKGANAG